MSAAACPVRREFCGTSCQFGSLPRRRSRNEPAGNCDEASRRHASFSIIGTVCAAAAWRPNAPRSNSPRSAISSRTCSCSTSMPRIVFLSSCRARASMRSPAPSRKAAPFSNLWSPEESAQYRRHVVDRDGCVLPGRRHRDRGAGRLARLTKSRFCFCHWDGRVTIARASWASFRRRRRPSWLGLRAGKNLTLAVSASPSRRGAPRSIRSALPCRNRTALTASAGDGNRRKNLI